MEANLANLVGEIRQALGDDPRRPRYVRTVHAFGYAFQGVAAEGAPKPAPGMVYRIIWKGGRATLGEGEHVLGRDADAAVALDSPSVSRRHARIVVTASLATLEDLGSKNGTSSTTGGRETGAAGGRRQAARRLRGPDGPDHSFRRQHADRRDRDPLDP